MKGADKALLKLFRGMHEEDARALLAFAEFLVERRGPVAPESLEPLLIERPVEESVVAAIRRLSDSYPMLDKSILLNQTSALMSQHVMEGRIARDVIDDLESLFLTEFENLLNTRDPVDD